MSIIIRCPKCSKVLRPKAEAHGQTTTCPKCQQEIEIRIPYGLSFNNPVLCGYGPSGEQRYLQRLRCSSGFPVNFVRGGTSIATDHSFLNQPDVSFEPGSSVAQTGGTEEEILKELPIDGYQGKCECGKHSAMVWFEMYHLGPEQIVGIPGWTLLRPILHRPNFDQFGDRNKVFLEWSQSVCEVCARVFSRWDPHCLSDAKCVVSFFVQNTSKRIRLKVKFLRRALGAIPKSGFIEPTGFQAIPFLCSINPRGEYRKGVLRRFLQQPVTRQLVNIRVVTFPR